MGVIIGRRELETHLASFIEKHDLTEKFLEEMEDLGFDVEDVAQELENLKE